MTSVAKKLRSQLTWKLSLLLLALSSSVVTADEEVSISSQRQQPQQQLRRREHLEQQSQYIRRIGETEVDLEHYVKRRKLFLPTRDLAIDGQWIVMFKNQPVNNMMQKTTPFRGGRIRLFDTINVLSSFVGSVSGVVIEESRFDVIARLLDDADVEWIEQDSIIQAYDLFDTYNFTNTVESIEARRDQYTQFAAPWGLDRLDNAYNGLNGLYNYKYTGDGVDIFIVDTGVQQVHVDLKDRVECELDLIPDEGGDCGDGRNHGTSVASVAAGSAYGVAKDATIRAIKILDKSGFGSTSNAIKALTHIGNLKTEDKKRKMVANFSLGGGKSEGFNLAIQKVVEQGVVVVGAAGNESVDSCSTSPASATSAIGVGASDITDKIPAWSNYGACVDIIAPGSSIIAAEASPNSIFSTTTKSGTSVAAPFVTGVAALFLEKYKDIKPEELFQKMKNGGAYDVLENAKDFNVPNFLVSTEFIDDNLPDRTDPPTASPTTWLIPVTTNDPTEKSGEGPTTIPAATPVPTEMCGTLFFARCETGDECCTGQCYTFDFMFIKGRRCWLRSN